MKKIFTNYKVNLEFFKLQLSLSKTRNKQPLLCHFFFFFTYTFLQHNYKERDQFLFLQKHFRIRSSKKQFLLQFLLDSSFRLDEFQATLYMYKERERMDFAGWSLSMDGAWPCNRQDFYRVCRERFVCWKNIDGAVLSRPSKKREKATRRYRLEENRRVFLSKPRPKARPGLWQWIVFSSV